MLRVQQGDNESYNTLFERHHRSIYGYLLRQAREQTRAEEVFQETWLKVHRSRSTYRPGQPFRPWLFRIAANTHRDVLRQGQRQVPLIDTEREPTPVREKPLLRMHIEDAIASLPDHLREAFLLGPVQGFGHRELAQLLDISPDNARARISRARSALRNLLEEK